MEANEIAGAMLADVEAVGDARAVLGVAQRAYNDYLLASPVEKAWAESRAVTANPETVEGKNEAVRGRAMTLALSQDPRWQEWQVRGRKLEMELERARNDYTLLVELQQARRYVIRANTLGVAIELVADDEIPF